MNASRIVASHLTADIGKSLTEHRRIRQVFQQIVDLTKAASHLRTVIVTAAVHRGFRSSLSALPLTFRHWAGVSPYTSPYGLAETCVFVKQSPGPAHCGLRSLRTQSPTRSKALLLPKLRS